MSGSDLINRERGILIVGALALVISFGGRAMTNDLSKLSLFDPSALRNAPHHVVEGSLDSVPHVNEGIGRAGLAGSTFTDDSADLLNTETVEQVASDRYPAIRNAGLDRGKFLVHDGLVLSDEVLMDELESLD